MSMFENMETPAVVSAAEWDAARKKLLVKEKEVTRAKDALAAERRRKPWQKIEKDTAFDGTVGKERPLDLFNDHRLQSVIDTTLAYASRGSQENIARLKEKMGWEQIPWYTVTDDFDKDMGVGEWHGTNAFIRDDGGTVYRTYFIDARGDEAMGSTWAYLDLTALGRQEEWEDSPEGYPQTPPYQWWRRHDEYTSEDLAGSVGATS